MKTIGYGLAILIVLTTIFQSSRVVKGEVLAERRLSSPSRVERYFREEERKWTPEPNQQDSRDSSRFISERRLFLARKENEGISRQSRVREIRVEDKPRIESRRLMERREISRENVRLLKNEERDSRASLESRRFERERVDSNRREDQRREESRRVVRVERKDENRQRFVREDENRQRFVREDESRSRQRSVSREHGDQRRVFRERNDERRISRDDDRRFVREESRERMSPRVDERREESRRVVREEREKVREDSRRISREVRERDDNRRVSREVREREVRDSNERFDERRVIDLERKGDNMRVERIAMERSINKFGVEEGNKYGWNQVMSGILGGAALLIMYSQSKQKKIAVD